MFLSKQKEYENTPSYSEGSKNVRIESILGSVNTIANKSDLTQMYEERLVKADSFQLKRKQLLHNKNKE